VYGETASEDEIAALARAHYGHLWLLACEFVHFRWLSAQRRAALVRIDNYDAFVAAERQGKGVLILTGHFGNWEVSTLAGLAKYPAFRGRFHFVRRAFKPRWLDTLITRRFNQAGFGVISKRGSLDRILDLLAAGDVIVFPFDQHAAPPDGIEVEFFSHPAWTFRSLAIIALATGAPVLPATGWREADGAHVMHFGEPIAAVEAEDTTDAIRRTTRAYNAELERLILARPEQWYWVHRRWKASAGKSVKRRAR
jgi:KDO2-lipid IV(A) lauroyltransferase